MLQQRPDETEYAPYAKGYVECVEGSNLLAVLAANTSEFVSLVRNLNGAFRYAPGKWTVNEVVGHITDAERIFASRLLCVARGDTTPFPPFEQDDYVATGDFNSRTLSDVLAEFEAVRQSSILLIKGLPADSWLRRGTVSGVSVTPRGLAFVLAGHERHHYRILRDKYYPSR